MNQGRVNRMRNVGMGFRNAQWIDFGPCCVCGQNDETVRNFMMLNRKTSKPGTGWGCVICDLPNDGALAILCDACLEANREPSHAVYGFPHKKQRILIADLPVGEHRHDMAFHP